MSSPTSLPSLRVNVQLVLTDDEQTVFRQAPRGALATIVTAAAMAWQRDPLSVWDLARRVNQHVRLREDAQGRRTSTAVNVAAAHALAEVADSTGLPQLWLLRLVIKAYVLGLLPESGLEEDIPATSRASARALAGP